MPERIEMKGKISWMLVDANHNPILMTMILDDHRNGNNKWNFILMLKEFSDLEPKIFPLLSYKCLTLPAPSISESYIKIKINLNFYFDTSLWCPKGFMKAFKDSIKPFEAPQRSAKIKIQVDSLPSSRIGTGRVNNGL